MRCPACGGELKAVEVQGVTLDACAGGCGGIFFDNFELQKFDEPHETADSLLKINTSPAKAGDTSKRHRCPKCDDVVMMRHYFSVKREVEVDECPSCGGYWLDRGELEKIRGLFESEEERHAAAEAHFDELFGEELQTMKENLAKQSEKTRRSAFYRFLTPSRIFRD